MRSNKLNSNYLIILISVMYFFSGQNMQCQDRENRYDNLGLPPRPSLEIRPVYSPDGKYIAFNSNRGGLFDIYKLEVATGNISQLTKNHGNNYVPKWSHDGSKIIFYSNYWGNPWSGEIDHDIWTMNADGSNLERVVTDDSQDMFGDWLKDGTGLVFASNRSGTRLLHTLEFETGKIAPLFENDQAMNFTMFQPMVHKNTGNIVFDGYSDGNSDIWLYNWKQQKVVRITSTEVDEYGPSISPGGTHILFQSSHGNGKVGVVRVDGSGYQIIANKRKGNFTTPIWTPDGRILTIYHHTESKDSDLKNWNIYTMDADGKNLKLVLDW